ncbi:hypothetical protein BCR36DRAFT_270438, partial [Piromyces finnis]
QATTQGQSSTQGQTTTQGQNPTQGQTTTQGAPQSAVTNANGGGNCAGDWAQCGGQGFNGPTCCTKGKCLKINEYYSQC